MTFSYYLKIAGQIEAKERNGKENSLWDRTGSTHLL